MTEFLAAAVLLLFIAVVVLAFVVLALARQIGVLHERVAPAGALMPGSGPKAGELAPQLELEAIDGRPVRVGGPADAAMLVLFVSPTCPICKSLVPTARSLARDEGGRLSLVFASDGADVERHRRYVADIGIEAYPYVVSTELGMKYEVGKLPFALLIDAGGVLRSKGLVNSREHLESLVEAMDSGFASIQDYLYREEDDGAVVHEVDPAAQPEAANAAGPASVRGG